MTPVLQDLRFAVRRLRKGPGFTITTVLTLALGIGATAAIFSLVNAVLLRPLPFPEPGRLVWLSQIDTTPGNPPDFAEPLSYPDFFDWRAQNHSFSGIASYRNSGFTLTGSGEPRQLVGEVVSSEFFRVLGASPMLGRGFRPEDEKPGAAVVVLSHVLWQTAFGGDRAIIGRALTLDGNTYTVTGVMPPKFNFPVRSPEVSMWTTLAIDATGKSPRTEQRGNDSLDVVARLKPGVNLDQVRADLVVIARGIALQHPDENKYYTAALVKPLIERFTGDLRPALRLLFAAVSLVLLIACVNVAGLLLARASHRRPEIALRTALGASRLEVMRQMLVESVLLSLCGGALGILLSSWVLDAMLRLVPKNLPRAAEVSVDGTVLLFVLLISLATGVLFGVLPAWRTSRLDPGAALREGATRSVASNRGRNRLHNWLVIAETALGLVLLVGSGLLIRSFVQIVRVNPGFNPHHVLTASIDLPEKRYTQVQHIEFYGQLLSRLSALPGVQSVAAGWPLPLSGSNIGVSFSIEGKPVAPGDEPGAAVNVVTADYFATLRIPVVAGRAFTTHDTRNSQPVIIVNQAFARKFFPGEDPVGKRMRSDLSDDDDHPPMREVVGVVGDVKRKDLTTAADPQYYLPWPQAVIVSPTLCIRTAGDPDNLVHPLRAELANLDRDIPLSRVITLDESMSRAASQPWFQTLLVTCFAGMALLLSAVGLYAVLSYMVVQRTMEIGVRVALGARSTDVLRMVLGRGLVLAGAGLAIGVAASIGLTRFLQDMLYRTGPLDAVTFAAVAAVVLLASLGASSVPAWRAARLDPMQTLRDQ